MLTSTLQGRTARLLPVPESEWAWPHGDGTGDLAPGPGQGGPRVPDPSAYADCWSCGEQVRCPVVLGLLCSHRLAVVAAGRAIDLEGEL